MPFMKSYREVLQPRWKKDHDDIVEWTLLRPFSIYLSVPLGKLGVRPAHASFLCFLAATIGAVISSSDSLCYIAIGAALFWFSFLLDCVDGELARYHKCGSMNGTYLDFLTGGVNDVTIMLGISFATALHTDFDLRWIIFLGVFSAAVERLVDLYSHSLFFRYVEAEWPKVEAAHAAPPKEVVPYTAMQKILRAPFTTFFRINLWLVMAVAAWALDAPILLTLGFIALVGLSLVYSAIVFYKRFCKGEATSLMHEKIIRLKNAG